MNTKKLFDKLIIIALVFYIFLLIFGIMLKAIMPYDLIANYNFLSTFNIKQRLIRGLNLIEFYQIEMQLNEFKKAIILDVLNIIIFIPLGILTTHFFKKHRIIKTILIALIFSFVIEFFQLITIIGAFMLNDLIANVIGSLIGSFIYVLVTKSKKYKIYNILLIVFIFIVDIVLIYSIINFISNIDIYLKVFMHFN